MEINLRKYHDRISAYDRAFQTSPLRYKSRVFWWITLGYVIVFAILLAHLALLGLLVWLQLKGSIQPWIIWCGGGAVGLSLVGMIRCLFWRIPLPDGLVISREIYPYLHELVDTLRKPMKLRNRGVRILVDWELNASAISRPAFGIFGPATHYLRFGLPLMACLNEEQLKAVIAHEIAHLSRKHSSLGASIARVAGTWEAILLRMQKNRISGAIFGPLFLWYAERLSAMAVVMRRHNELEADRLAAAAVSPKAMIQALVRMGLRDDMVVQDHWREIWRNALIDEVPVLRAVSRLLNRLERDKLDETKAFEELRWQLGDFTEFYDSHPCLSDRIAALGIDFPDLQEESLSITSDWGLFHPESTLRKFLGKDRRESGILLDQIWCFVNHLPWTLTYLMSLPLADLMRNLDKEWKEKGRLSVEKAWKRAAITERFYGQEAALPIADYILRQDENHPYANFVKGCQLMRRYDSSCIFHIEAAMEGDPISYREAGLTLLSGYYKRLGGDADYEEAKYESFEAGQETLKAIKERARKISFTDTFGPHDLSKEDAEDLAEVFEYFPGIRKVHLVTRTVEHLPESKFYVFAVFPSLWGRLRYPIGDYVSTELFPFSRQHRVVLVGLSRLFIRRKFTGVENSVLYRRKLFRKHKVREGATPGTAPKKLSRRELKKREKELARTQGGDKK